MKVGFLQFNPIHMDKYKNVEKVIKLIKTIEADLLILPELFNSGYYFENQILAYNIAEKIPDGFTTKKLIEISKSKNMYICAGLAENYKNKIYNSAILVGPCGLIGSYRKIHLFDKEKEIFTPGNRKFTVFDIGIAKIGIMICFDWLFPESARSLALLGADIICHPANLVLPWCQRAMTIRCLENRVFAITANRVGIEKTEKFTLRFTGSSQITGVKGEILYRAHPQKEEVKVIEINPELARDKKITPNNHIFNDLRPGYYTTQI